MTSDASRDQNDVPTLLGVSNADNSTPVKIWASPSTHRLLVDSSGGGGTPASPVSSIQYNNAGAFGGSSTLLFDGNETITFGAINDDPTIQGVTGTGANAGSNLHLNAGSADAGSAGTIGLQAGSSNSLKGGNIFIEPGTGSTSANPGNVYLSGGDGSLPTNATGGFVYFNSVAGTPSGTPNTIDFVNTIPVVFDRTNSKFYFYNSTWQALTPGTVPSFADNETPSGTINGSNAVFTLAHTPSPTASLQLFLNGAFQTAAGTDYTLATATITFGSAPLTGSILRAFYRY